MAYKQYLLLLSLCSIGLKSMEVQESALCKQSCFHNLKLQHENRRFFTEFDGVKRQIEPAYIDRSIRNIDTELLKKMTAAGCYLKLNPLRSSSSEFSLQLRERGLGGGPWLAGLTFIVGSVATAVGTAATAITVTATAGPVAGGLAAYSAAAGGMAITAKATATAAVLPTI